MQFTSPDFRLIAPALIFGGFVALDPKVMEGNQAELYRDIEIAVRRDRALRAGARSEEAEGILIANSLPHETKLNSQFTDIFYRNFDKGLLPDSMQNISRAQLFFEQLARGTIIAILEDPTIEVNEEILRDPFENEFTRLVMTDEQPSDRGTQGWHTDATLITFGVAQKGARIKTPNGEIEIDDDAVIIFLANCASLAFPNSAGPTPHDGTIIKGEKRAAMYYFFSPEYKIDLVREVDELEELRAASVPEFPKYPQGLIIAHELVAVGDARISM